MKKKGNVCDYTIPRNRELCMRFRHAIARAKVINLDRIFREVASMSASRFFVSETRALLVISNHLKSGKWCVSQKLRIEMFEEIESRALHLLQTGACSDLEEAVFEVVNSEAPSFYLTPRSCRTIIYNEMKYTPASEADKPEHSDESRIA